MEELFISKRFVIFVICSDERSLKYLLEQREKAIGCHTWVTKLLGYEFEIRYKLGASNRVADVI